MLRTNFSNLQIIHTARTPFSVAFMLSRDFSQILNKRCQLQHKAFTPHIEIMQLKPNNA